MTVLQLKQFNFPELFTTAGLEKLDAHFVHFLAQTNPELAEQLKCYRAGKLTAAQSSEWIIASASILEKYIAQLFGIELEVSALYQATHHHDPIFQFKDHYVHQAKRLLKTVTDIAQFESLNKWLEKQIEQNNDIELAVAKLGLLFLSDKNHYQNEIEKLTHWCALAMQCEAGRHMTENWSSFHQAQKKNYENLVPMVPVENDVFGRFEAPILSQRERDGFKLTDQRMPLREVLDEIHYCVYCHKNEGDFCSKGFPVKKNNPEMGLKTNPAGDLLTGCPLEAKISEMHVVKKNGFGIGALAIVTIDNPFCAVTGHRICNDCMKACIYQKQDPVNIPEIETRVLTDVLNLPWGVEIYDLLIRWNPLRQTQILPKHYNSTNILVMGMGPAGFTLAHHLLMEGCAVVGCDGLKIEPLPTQLLNKPIKTFSAICESLDDRIMSGFGGVSEYGITVRWDKNFLKLVYLSLARRPCFQLFGNVRFGGTMTVENAWSLGFHHLAIAVGAGLSRELPIPNSLAPGMRQANDFLMTLQLSGAIKKSSLANIQVQLPAVVIGGGLTGVDTATEVQAYYIVQVEKTHQRYHILKSEFGENALRAYFDAHDLSVLDEHLSHAEKIMAERIQAKKENRAPQLNRLIREWGGVTIAYRKSIQESPAYQRNHEELTKALQEGIYYAEGLEPAAVLLDEYGSTAGLTCHSRVQDEFGQWIFSTETKTLPAKALFVATGAKPNIAYEFEHRGTFERSADAYQSYEDIDDTLIPAENRGHVKSEPFGILTSYDRDHHKVSFLGDTHPVFHGSVVKAIASAKRGYPKIMAVLKTQLENPDQTDYFSFSQKIKSLLSAEVISIKRHTNYIIELSVKAPLAAKHFKPGQFYRIQNYETAAPFVGDTRLQTETISALGIFDKKYPDQLSFFIFEKGASTKLVATFQVGQAIAIMGPTGSKINIPQTTETILIVGNAMAIPYLLSVGSALKKSGHQIIFVVNTTDLFAENRIHAIADESYVCKNNDEIIQILQKINLEKIKSVTVIGDALLLKTIQHAHQTTLKNHFHQAVKFTGSVYGSMQCMLKGVCAQCLQWQIDPSTGKRTKAVYACSWQHQPMELIDIDHLDDRLGQNKMQETLANLWVTYLFEKHSVEKI
ncbi:MAG: pyridine nucleotide-disulfide oxidoreductase [Gammaproteobacteria bacterium CG_4_9_14_3_um_filter_38_9]|nr:MAG: pyridine nucleotide-disulfide oxidoreductase [Gammaproteobacteria bacterium CG_4_9_14_3_um_filter_38_9]